MTRAAVLLALCCLVALAHAHRDDFMSMSRTRRMPGGGMLRMRGYVGLSRKGGYPMAFAGGYAGARSQHAPAFSLPGESAEEDAPADEEPQPEPVVASGEEEQEEPQHDDEEEDPAPAPEPVRPSRAKPVKPTRPSPVKPARPVRPTKPAVQEEEEEEEDDFPPPSQGGNGKNRGATAIATSYSNGKGAVANSHAIAYDGFFSGGQYKHRY